MTERLRIQKITRNMKNGDTVFIKKPGHNLIQNYQNQP